MIICRFKLLIAVMLITASCKATESDQHASYVYANFFDTLLPIDNDENHSKVSISETKSYRLAVLNKNIRVSLSDSVNICDANKLNLLLNMSKDCSSVVLYAVDESTLSSEVKSQLNVYKQNYEFNHLSGNALKKATVYKNGVLFEYSAGDELSIYFYKKELGNSKIFQYSVYDAPIGLFDNIDLDYTNQDIERIAVSITSFLNNELSAEEFMELDLDITVNIVEL